MTIQHSAITDPDIHEVKGASTATLGQVLRANGDGTATFTTTSSVDWVDYSVELSSGSTSTQNPSGTDTALQVSFGSATATSAIDLDASGTITALEAGTYEFTFNFNISRANNTGTAQVYLRLLVNNVMYGFTQGATLSSNNNSRPSQFTLTLPLDVNDEVKVQVARDSAGSNDGGLYPLTAPNLGWDTVPSAWVRVKKLVGVNQ